jgi:hypothetical protein
LQEKSKKEGADRSGLLATKRRNRKNREFDEKKEAGEPQNQNLRTCLTGPKKQKRPPCKESNLKKQHSGVNLSRTPKHFANLLLGTLT